MKAQQMWDAYAAREPQAAGRPFEAWAYGDAPDELAALTLRGVKRATSSAHALYAAEGEPLPETGAYSVILNSREEAVCVIRTTAVTIVPYCRVSAAFAAMEGEGDRSLEHWRKVHESFFTRELARAGLLFTQDTPVVCEEFEVVYK